ncbi:hypothetical protein [Streptomyces cyaneofuscatus]|uniref:hypothetical protein n=1 Tax=Streptomyces cyaneofuscatus TaxID=66883 RepID=UPI0034191B50
MTRVPIKWDHFNGGDIHSFTDGELRELLNSDVRGFRARMGVMCRRNGWAHATRTELVGDTTVFQFCISTEGVKPHLPRLPGRHPGRQGAPGRHRDCEHPNTKLDRERCRHVQYPETRRIRQRQQKARARLAEEQAAKEWARLTQERAARLAQEAQNQTMAGWLSGLRKLERAVLLDPDGDVIQAQKEAIYKREVIRRRVAREHLEAQGKLYGWRKHGGYENYLMGGGPPVKALAYYLLVRMKNDRDHKGFYQFTMEWVRSHYPHLLANYPDVVHDALTLLTLRGKVKWL